MPLLRTSEALRSMMDQHDGATVAAVAHDSVNRALLVQLLDLALSAFWSFKEDPCCINVIAIGGRKPVRTINSTAHLNAVNSRKGDPPDEPHCPAALDPDRL